MNAVMMIARTFLRLQTALLFVGVTAGAQAQEKPLPRPFAVLELFTSQGCAKCPPAEALLARLIREAEKNGSPVYALEYHVDYWNKYGWKDPYSSFKYTLRQRNYVSVLPESQAYTPQLIINGSSAMLGSDEKQIRALLEKSLNTTAPVTLEIAYRGIVNDTMQISYSSSRTDKNYFLKIALVDKEVSNAVGKGENEGKTLVHHNVVILFNSYDLNRPAGRVLLPLNKKVPGRNQQLIAFVQHRQTMKILGAVSAGIPATVK